MTQDEHHFESISNRIEDLTREVNSFIYPFYDSEPDVFFDSDDDSSVETNNVPDITSSNLRSMGLYYDSYSSDDEESEIQAHDVHFGWDGTPIKMEN